MVGNIASENVTCQGNNLLIRSRERRGTSYTKPVNNKVISFNIRHLPLTIIIVKTKSDYMVGNPPIKHVFSVIVSVQLASFPVLRSRASQMRPESARGLSEPRL